jgi:hypothetical protein
LGGKGNSTEGKKKKKKKKSPRREQIKTGKSAIELHDKNKETSKKNNAHNKQSTQRSLTLG